MTLDELAGLLSASRFFPHGEPAEREALRALPELADGLPAVVFDARGAHVWSGCGEAVRAAGGGLAAQLLEAGNGHLGGALEEDPFVAALARLVVEGARHSPGAAVVPLLEAVRVAQDVQGDPGLRKLRSDPAALRRVGAAVQARLATACAVAERTLRVPALAWAVARDRLLPVFARGTLDRDPAWAEVAAVLEVPLPVDTVETVEKAVRIAVRGIAERRAAGRTTADDATLLVRTLPPGRLDPGAEPAAAALLYDPDGLAALLPMLGRFVDVQGLVAVGVDKARAERLLTPAGGLATASVLVELLGALRAWDVLSQLVDATGPAPLRALGVPRATPTRAAVLAVGVGRLRAEGGAAESAWEELARAPDGGVLTETGGVVVFVDAVDALRFALSVRQRIPTAAMGLAWGPVFGGTDGAVARFGGPTVDAAVRWVAGAAGPARAGDGQEGGLRSAGGWLCGQGLAVDAAAAEAVQEARVRRGLATAADGPPGGDARVPRSLDLHRVYDFDGDVLALVRIPGVTGGFEALHMSSAAWRSLLDRDGERANSPVAAIPAPVEEPVAVPAPALAEGEGDDGVGWEMAEQDELPEEAPVTLDLGESTGEAWSAPAAQPGFEFDPEGEGAPAEDDSPFSGFYLPGAEKAAAAPAPAAPARPATASFDMLVEDEEEETDDWGADEPTPANAGIPVVKPVSAAPAPPAAPRAEDVSTDSPVATLDPFGGDPFADAFTVPEELRDPATPAPSRVAVDPFAVGAGASDDPFTSSGRPSPVAAPAPSDPFGDDDPFAGYAPGGVPATRAPEPADPFAADPFAGPSDARPAKTASSDPFGADPFSREPTADPRTGGSSGGVDRSRAGIERAPVQSLDFDFLLKGYACFFEKREAVFGRPYGTRMVDRHAYPYSGDPDEAYTAFLQDKIREGFVPRADMMGDLPRGVTLMPLDAEKLQRAWKDLS